jgi:hypothetical protein
VGKEDGIKGIGLAAPRSGAGIAAALSRVDHADPVAGIVQGDR